MIGSEVLGSILAALAWYGFAFCCGVGWAAYRAVGWVERIRAWAYSAPAQTPMLTSCIATMELDGMGLE